MLTIKDTQMASVAVERDHFVVSGSETVEKQVVMFDYDYFSMKVMEDADRQEKSNQCLF